MLTLAIPYHAKPELLALTLASVLAQLDPDWLAVVCDDSPTGSGEPVVKAVGDPRVHYVRNPNPAGMVANWNFAVSCAMTERVTLLHADDELAPTYVGCMRSLASRHPEAAMLYCKADVIDLSGRLIFSFPDHVKRWIEPPSEGDVVLSGETAAAALLRGNFIFCPSACYRRELLLRQPFNPRYKMVQDLELFLRLLESGQTLVGSAERAYRYRRHENATAVMTRELTRFHEEIALYRDCALRYAAQGWPRASAVAGGMRIIRLHLAYRLCADLLGLRLPGAWAKLRLLAQVAKSKGLLSGPGTC
jgi:glycosyltransferase involved in cell wall biosynthesis